MKLETLSRFSACLKTKKQRITSQEGLVNMREKYEEELRKLNTAIITMGKMIEVAIESSILALMSHDSSSADAIIKADDAIDEKEKEIEQLCIKLLLQQQPVATDLRLITSALKMVTDMERIGDHAEDIADLMKWEMKSRKCSMTASMPTQTGTLFLQRKLLQAMTLLIICITR